ncbi:MAG: hypothetical protein LUG51_09565 [Tannerellaceae bacterium]|nr:hypothetical protein [Tannerellaceae bacterium]
MSCFFTTFVEDTLTTTEDTVEEKTQNTFRNFSHIYEKYAPGLLFYARKFVSYPVAEDIVHDVFLNIWKKILFCL